MVGYVENERLVTCMELYYSESLKVGVIQIRAPPIKTEKFVRDLLEWFNSSGNFKNVIKCILKYCTCIRQIHFKDSMIESMICDLNE